ncbi:Nitronate monooxygenase [Lasiodiplodia theobromae]|uniref:Nitronate monooxygenase n=1 Tax=Lasiodiplodia theobromae TaxID=45133 RepID=A0A5N5D4T7_9PEZI|nr:Nitronate monooxygenase [Lasiodiplodia theobromae]
MASSTLQKTYPWTQTPLIINGPMGGFAGPELAAAVTNAGGIGFIAGGLDLSALDKQIGTYRTLLAPHISSSPPSSSTEDAVLPVGLGFLCFGAPLADAAALVAKHRPAAAWLFAPPQLADHATWARALRHASPRTQIWVQTGSVGAALQVAREAAPDVLVLQGADAGGHGFERGAGIVSLLPEAADALAEAGCGVGIKLVAAGGIVEGRGAAAALALGAEGVVMGTRFLACDEVVHEGYRRLILEARDGGQRTVRSKAFDEARPGGNCWPEIYDGRGIENRTYADFLKGVEGDELRRLHAESQKNGKVAGFGEEELRVTVWAGTGVGLVKDILPAGKIVEDVREGARKVLKNLSAQL